MLVLKIESAPNRILGYCSSWALQVATGVYVANLPKREREQIWSYIERSADLDTKAVMVWASPVNEQGLECRVLGYPRRTVVDREGLLISTWLPRGEIGGDTPSTDPSHKANSSTVTGGGKSRRAKREGDTL